METKTKFGPTIHIFESQTEQQLLNNFEDDEITKIRTVHTHFWKPNRTTTTTLKMTKLPKFGLSNSMHIFESQTEQQLLRDFEDDEITEIWTNHTHFESQTEQQLLRDFEDDIITEIQAVHTHFWKPKRTTTTTSKMMKLPKFGLSIHIFESQKERQLLREFEDVKIWTNHTHFCKPNRTTTY